MACLVTPATAALVTKMIGKKIPARYHIEWLYQMLVGGTIMLLVDHVLKGEIIPYAPFFTSSPAVLLSEIIRVGGTMTVATVIFWAGMVTVANWKNRSVARQNC